MARGAAAGALARMALPALDGIRASWNDTCNYDNLNRRRVTPQRFPVVLEPAGDPSDLAVLRARRSEIMDLIHAHGAVLLRHWTTKELPAFVESLERVLGAEAEGTHYHKISMLRGEGRKATAHDTGVEIWRLVEALVIEDDDDDKKPAVRDAVELPAIEKKMLEDARDPFEEIEDAEAIRIDFEAESPAKNDLTCGCGPAAM